jgi:alkylation response protein AidB-like acyl-CoA dehydrogenase
VTELFVTYLLIQAGKIMEFKWNEEQKELREAVSRFAKKELNEDVIERDRLAQFSDKGWKKCAEFGIQGLCVPEEFGGSGLDALTTVGVLERLGYSCKDNGLIFSINAMLWTVSMPIVIFGTKEQKTRYLSGLCNGTLIGANAMSEPNTGSDAYSMRTTAEKKNGAYYLNGSKTFVTNGPIADLYVAYANVDLSKGAKGITAFIIDKDAPGLKIGGKIAKMGLRTSPISEIFFDNCEVPEENRLAPEGKGALVFTESMSWERGSILSSAVGTMERLMETCLRYARDRKQFGEPIGKFQQVANKIVDMRMRIECSRHMLYHCAWLKSRQRSNILEAAMAKLKISDDWIHVCQEAMQIHGGYGYTVDYEIERDLRDAMGSKIYSGTSEIQRNIAASMLGL